VTATGVVTAAVDVAGARLHVEDGGHGAPVVLVHGSWDDADSWARVAASLRATHRVVAYDRRGHTRSTAPPGQGTVAEDVDDLLAVIVARGLGPATVVGHSYGATVALAAAVRSPADVPAVVAHEPPLYGLLRPPSPAADLAASTAAAMAEARRLLEDGDVEQGARLFLEDVAFGPGAWSTLWGDEGRAALLANAGTWLDQARDPHRLTALDPADLAKYPGTITITTGTATLPGFAAVVATLAARAPNVRVVPVEGAGHGPHLSHPDAYAATLRTALAS
jgi:esterase